MSSRFIGVFELEHYRQGKLIGKRKTPNLMTKWGAIHFIEYGISIQRFSQHIDFPALPGDHEHFLGLIADTSPVLDIFDATNSHVGWIEFEDYFNFTFSGGGRGGGGNDVGASFAITADGSVGGAFLTLTKSGNDAEDILHEGIFTHSTPPSIPPGPAFNPIDVLDGDQLKVFYRFQVWNQANFPSPDPIIPTIETDIGAPGF